MDSYPAHCIVLGSLASLPRSEVDLLQSFGSLLDGRGPIKMVTWIENLVIPKWRQRQLLSTTAQASQLQGSLESGTGWGKLEVQADGLEKPDLTCGQSWQFPNTSQRDS